MKDAILAEPSRQAGGSVGAEVMATAGLALLVRACFLAIVFATGSDLGASTPGDDAYAYVSQARIVLGEKVDVPVYERRGFPGLLVALAILHAWVGLPFVAAGVAMTFIGAVLAASTMTWLSRDVRVGVLASVFTPHWLWEGPAS